MTGFPLFLICDFFGVFPDMLLTHGWLVTSVKNQGRVFVRRGRLVGLCRTIVTVSYIVTDGNGLEGHARRDCGVRVTDPLSTGLGLAQLLSPPLAPL